MVYEFNKLDATTRAWLRQIYKGLAPAFVLKPKITVDEVSKALYVKSIESRRLSFEQTWYPRIGALLRKAGRETGLAYKGSQDLIHTQQVADREIREPMRKLLDALMLDVEATFIKMVPVSLLPAKGTTMSDLRKQDEIGDLDEAEWALQDPLDLPKMLAYNRVTVASHVARITASTMRWIEELVTDALAEGWSVDRVAKKLQELYGFSFKRARLIAQTEVVGASNAATYFSIDHNAPTATMTKDWLNAGDHRVRKTHVQAGLDQIDVPFSQPFEVGGSQLMFPGDQSLGAAGKETIGCRCTTLYQTPGSRRGRIDQRRERNNRRAGKR